MIKVPEKIKEAVQFFKEEGWTLSHLLNVSEFITWDYEAVDARPEIQSRWIASYLSIDEENIVNYVKYVLSIYGEG